jgi:hypothetical protein
MSRYRYNQRKKAPLLEKVADDLPKGYAKAALDLFNGSGTVGKIVVAGLAIMAAKTVVDKFKR